MRGKRLVAAAVGVSVVLVPVAVWWVVGLVRAERQVRDESEAAELWFLAVMAEDYTLAGQYDVAGEAGASARARAITDRVGPLRSCEAAREQLDARPGESPGYIWHVVGDEGEAQAVVRFRRLPEGAKITSVSMGMD